MERNFYIKQYQFYVGEKMKTAEIRSLFLDYFIKHGHNHVDSSSLIPTDDDTLLFTNSGMVQFKNIFTGKQNTEFKKATTIQKSLRAGGKHNDLDNVGYTARHHTFFEMLGNFSFGDYFKEEAILHAWNIINKEFGLPRDKLVVTVYHNDDEAYDLWKKIAQLKDEQLIRISTNDNFWEMGDSGPCGPCSEIFYDYGDSVKGGKPGSADQDGDRFVEVWNLVFMQYEKLKDGSIIPLKKPCIDTGMGLERIASVLQGKKDNYDIDLFQNIMKYQSELLGVKITPDNKTSFKVIADHLRACSFMVADGIIPSNEGRGYVLRRILRRAIRYCHMLGSREPIMHKFVPALKNEMTNPYKELAIREEYIIETLKQEEIKFYDTFDNGIKILNDELTKLQGDELSGKTAFKLYETYGFPIDLTSDILRQKNLNFNKKEFDEAFEHHRNLAKQSWVGGFDNKSNQVWLDLKEKITNFEFCGYDSLVCQSRVLAIVEFKDDELKSVLKNQAQECFIILDKSPFYAEMGGQKGDVGSISIEGGFFAEIVDTQKKEGLVIHKALIKDGSVSVGDSVIASVNGQIRKQISMNHTVAHLLHASLDKHLGHQVAQQGAMINESRLRFDISHKAPLTALEIELVENDVNNAILSGLPIITEVMELSKAIAGGAKALFSEKYPEQVRVVSIGNSQAPLLSIELCGGTHAKNTSEIGLFKITNESSVSSGVRRIEGVCGLKALEYFNQYVDQSKKISKLLSIDSLSIYTKIENLLNENKALSKDILKATNKYYLSLLNAKIDKISNTSYLVETLDDVASTDLKEISNALLLNKNNFVSLLFSKNNNGKRSFILSKSQDLNSFDLKEFTKILLPLINGSGGGSNVFMQGNCDDNLIGNAKVALLDAIK
jgi:alanyl-tRNA synthetase